MERLRTEYDATLPRSPMVAQQPSACAQVMRGPLCRVALRTCILSPSLSHDRLRGIQDDTMCGEAGERASEHLLEGS